MLSGTGNAGEQKANNAPVMFLYLLCSSIGWQENEILSGNVCSEI